MRIIQLITILQYQNLPLQRQGKFKLKISNIDVIEHVRMTLRRPNSIALLAKRSVAYSGVPKRSSLIMLSGESSAAVTSTHENDVMLK